MIEIICSDAVKWAKEYQGPLFHALLCDPPYHLTSITKRFGKGDAAPAQCGTDGAFARAGRGFMGKQWDGGDVAFDPETWAAFASVLYPGAFGMAFASSRGWHRLAVAIEDAGLIIHPSIFGWAYGSGFPKATRVKDERFEGHRYGGQALKPALEPIIVFQKPYIGRPIENITTTGAGTLNIDSGRIGTDEIPSNQWTDAAHPFGNGAGNEYKTEFNTGRWPANFILMDQQSADALDRQSGHLLSGSDVIRQKEGVWSAGDVQNGSLGKAGDVQVSYGDEGGASRFFYQVAENLDLADPVHYCAKPSRDEKECGLNHMPLLLHGVSGGSSTSIRNNEGYDQAQSIGLNKIQEVRNPHPTVKPIDLSRYLAALLLPPVEYGPRRLFVPFSGVASECIGAMRAGWEEITGVELTEEYIPIAEARVKHWSEKGYQTSF